jgi:AbrB family looped-hinge helix DNA binding protein
MALVQVDERHRLTLPKEVREKFRIVNGQKFYLVPSGDDLIMKPIPRGAEKWLLKETKASHKKRSSL